MTHLPSITVADLNARLQDANAPLLLDVREPKELAICKLNGVMNLPLGQLPQIYGVLPRDREIVVICHHGGRSAKATQLLLDNGFNAVNLTGGMHQWATEIDPAMATY